MMADKGKSGEWNENREWKRDDDDLVEEAGPRGREDLGRTNKRAIVVKMRARRSRRRIGRIVTDVLP
jgi:hypothetical protein